MTGMVKLPNKKGSFTVSISLSFPFVFLSNTFNNLTLNFIVLQSKLRSNAQGTRKISIIDKTRFIKDIELDLSSYKVQNSKQKSNNYNAINYCFHRRNRDIFCVS